MMSNAVHLQSDTYPYKTRRYIVAGKSRLRLVAAFLTGFAGFAIAGNAHSALYENDKLKISADFRLRMEQDWDSQSSSGVDRDDRARARVRARVGLNYKADENISFGIRLRSGSDGSQQSPHITIADFNSNDTGDAHFNFDKWYLKGKTGNLWGWAGRNGFPFWTPNEMFWDDDVTLAGLAGGYKKSLNDNTSIAFNTGYFSLPAGMKNFSGDLAAGQVVLSTKMADMGIIAAAGWFGIDADKNDPDNAIYLQNNGMRDYSIWVVNLQAKMKAGGKPLSLGVDYMHNTEDYNAADLVGASAGVDEGDTDGYVVYALYGSLKDKGEWLAGYYYAHIEEFAVNNSYAQDDWVRWGNATQTRASNLKGHELRGAYAFAKNINLVGRLYLVEAISDNNQEDGNRFRLDLNIKF